MILNYPHKFFELRSVYDFQILSGWFSFRNSVCQLKQWFSQRAPWRRPAQGCGSLRNSCRGLTGILGSENGGLPRGACVPVPSPLSCVFSLCMRSRPDCRCQIRTAWLPNWEAGSVFPCCRSILSEGGSVGKCAPSQALQSEGRSLGQWHGPPSLL